VLKIRGVTRHFGFFVEVLHPYGHYKSFRRRASTTILLEYPHSVTLTRPME